MGSIWAEKKVSSAVHRSKKVGELEIRLHLRSVALQKFCLKVGRKPTAEVKFKKYLMELILSRKEAGTSPLARILTVWG